MIHHCQPSPPENLLGFVILTHEKPPQILRLINRLVAMFGETPIVCHHDFSKCDLDLGLFPRNVSFVRPHIVTYRAGWSLVTATIAGLRALYDRKDAPEWFTLLSGADYPIKPAEVILGELQESSYDAFLEYGLIDPESAKNDHEKRCVWRYFRRHVQLPGFAQRFMPFSENRALPAWFPMAPIPFSSQFRCYAGSQFFTANRKSAQYILEWHSRGNALAKHYERSRVPVPDKSYFLCGLCNEPGLRILNDNRRYIIWRPGIGHPKTLTMADLPLLLKSPAHFARKFDLNDPVLDEIDKVIDRTFAGQLVGRQGIQG